MKKKDPQKHDVQPPDSEWEKICESKKREKSIKILVIVLMLFFILLGLAFGIIGGIVGNIPLVIVGCVSALIALGIWFFSPLYE